MTSTIGKQDMEVPARVIGIQFSMLSPEEIRRNSVVEISSRDTYNNNKPVPYGLFDTRMGVLEPGMICPTDGLTYMDTPGYFGHIELARPVFAMQHIKEIMKIARCVCFKCSKLLIDKTKYSYILERPAEDRWEFVSKEASGINRCGNETDDGCGCRQPSRIMLEGMCKIEATWPNLESSSGAGATAASGGGGDAPSEPVKIILTPEIILKIFRRITDDDVYFMGFHPKWSRPEWMVFTVLPVPPPSVRPSVKYDAQQRSEDDLTHIYSNIIKCNTILKEKLADPAQVNSNTVEKFYLSLQYYVAAIVNNKMKGMEPMFQRSTRPLQCIMDRLNTKYGRIRGNLMGKRVDFSARSVITGDPNLSIRQLGVPLKIAKNITKPETVNVRNRAFLTTLVKNGPDVYPGAKILERKTGEHVSLRYVDRKGLLLHLGDIVHRHMMDGDAVLFNRQPSLHRMSMMCHIVKVMKRGDTFRINVGCTKPYNADFDGDEMNMHMSQNVLAETELKHLAAIPYQIISPSGNAPIIGIYQDSLLGAYRFTREHVKFTMAEAMNLLMRFSHVDTDALRILMKRKDKKSRSITSFDILSQLMPPLTMQYSTKLFSDKDDDYRTSNHVVEIRNGKYVRGQMEKSVLGQSTRGILHRVYNDFGPMACSNFIDDLQNVITEYMKTSSYSVGISDLIADPVTQGKINTVIEQQKSEVRDLMDKLHLGVFENNSSRSNQQHFESMINNVLNKATDESGKIGRSSLSSNNRFKIIVDSGSKGTAINISHMISCVGQQNVEGKRIPYGLDGRTLPHFRKYDDGPSARGFIDNSYMSGLTPSELFFLAMGGRIGLIDTAVKSVTWETPIVFIERGVPKYMEIGRWIDGQLDDPENGDHVQHFPNDRNLELLELAADSVYIPTTDEDGKVTWGQLTAVTRHDPGTALYEIKTTGGRSVIVTESKSLLVWNAETKKLQEMQTPDIRVGDCVPVTAQLKEPPVIVDCIHYGEGELFRLDEDNGLRMGIYLANGVDPQSSYQGIFEGLTESGNCIPTEAFFAPDIFVSSLLKSYSFARAYSLHRGTMIAMTGKSRRLLEGMAMLLSRLGIFSELHPEDVKLMIQGRQWLQRFEEYFPTLMTIRLDECEDATPLLQDVALDPILSITKMGVEKHPKMYDVTVPSTLNFGLANGLQVRDTSKTGYIQRRLIKGLEDLKVEYDMTVRNNRGKIIQFLYGDDGFDSTRVENQTLPLVGMSVEDVYLHYDIIGANNQTDEVLHVYTQAAADRIRKQKAKAQETCKRYIDKMLQAREDVVRRVFKSKNDSSVFCPIAFQHVIANCQGQLDLTPATVVDLTPLEAFEMIEANLAKMNAVVEFAPVTPLFEILYYFYLTPKHLLVYKRFHKKALELLLEMVTLKFKEALVHPGEMVGIVAGQSIGEPTTQLTLNTFHMSGVSSKSNVTMGVPRIEEILRLTSNPKNPSLTVHLKPLEEQDMDKASIYATMMEHTRLVDVVESVQICFDPNPTTTQIDEDRTWLEQFYEFERWTEQAASAVATATATAVATATAATTATPPQSKWVVRFVMDAETMLHKNITMDDIHFALTNSKFNDDIACAFSDYNASELVFRIRMNAASFAKGKRKGGATDPLDQSDDIYVLKMFQDQLLNQIVLRGVHGIEKVTTRKLQSSVVLLSSTTTTTSKDDVTKRDGKYVKKDTWVLDTTGTNLLEVLALDYIDATRTFSNDIREVFHVLGLEAARQMIYNEMSDVMEFSGGGYINYHHLGLLCDRMTCNHNMIPIFRSGLLSDDTGPIAKCTFEEQTAMLLQAARHGDVDPMRGVSANVMCGQFGNYGTSSFQLVLDMEAMASVEAMPMHPPRDDAGDDDDDEADVADTVLKSKMTIHNNIVNLSSSTAMHCGVEEEEEEEDQDFGF